MMRGPTWAGSHRGGPTRSAMPKRILAALSQDPAEPPLYFLGYEDHGQAGTLRWSRSRNHARWFDADEAEVEARLLAPDHTGHLLSPEPLGL